MRYPMPLYRWRDQVSGKELEVLRKFDDYQVPPNEDDDEDLIGLMTPEEAGAADWVRVIGGGIKVVKGDTWGPGKGHW